VGRTHGFAVLGAAAVLISSFAVTTSDSGTPPAVVPAEVTPTGERHDRWALRAQRVLASLDEQLDLVADAEAAWGRAADVQRVAARSAPIEALRERKLLLLQRQASLRSQLETHQSLREAARRLALAEQQLAAIEAALRDVPGRRPTPEQVHAVATLEAQRDLRIAQRDARREEVQRLEQAVSVAARTPLPADDRHTAVVSGLVLDSLADTDEPEAPRQAPRARPPDVVADRADDVLAQARADIPDGSPPGPRGPRPEPLGDVVDTVRVATPKRISLPLAPGVGLDRMRDGVGNATLARGDDDAQDADRPPRGRGDSARSMANLDDLSDRWNATAQEIARFNGDSARDLDGSDRDVGDVGRILGGLGGHGDDSGDDDSGDDDSGDDDSGDDD